MIRDYQDTDLSEVMPMVMAGKHMKPDEIAERMGQGRAWVYDDGHIRGCAVMTPVRKTDLGPRIDLWLYTDPNSRGRGVGSHLWTVVWASAQELHPRILVTGYRSDSTNASQFFAARGFNRWHASHLMAYDGPDFALPPMDLQPYSNCYFSEYVGIINRAFFQLRRDIDATPYEVYPDGFDEVSLRQELELDHERIFLLRQAGHVVAVARLGPDYIDEIAVDPDSQGQGYGAALTRFCVNRLRQQGVQRVYLGVVDTNARAINLYQRLGFTRCETHEYARRFIAQA